MRRLVLAVAASVLFVGACNSSSGQEASLAQLEKELVEKGTGQVTVSAVKPAFRQQAHEAHFAELADETKQAVLRMEEIASEMEARLKAHEDQVVAPEEEARHAQVLQALNKARSHIEEARATQKRMTKGLTPDKRG